MGWKAYQDGSYGLAGSAVQVAAGLSQLVRLNLAEPEQVCLQLEAPGVQGVVFAVQAGTGTAARTFELLVPGGASSELQVLAESLQVNARSEGAAPAEARAWVAPGPAARPVAPGFMRSQSFNLAAGGTATVPARARRRVLVHGVTGMCEVAAGGLRLYLVNPGQTVELEYSGPVALSSTAGCLVNVGEAFL